MRVAKFRRPGTEPLCREFAAFIARFARRTPSGAVALDHVLAVVPTAEAGRRLRIALVREFGALVPPRICSPRQFFAQSPGRG
ncbi:MAG: hypothetical protein IJS46_04450, partial [Kiritimatiellae bacterium]|nr:hypothetical protein [Kiritimatiellia bacterium]